MIHYQVLVQFYERFSNSFGKGCNSVTDVGNNCPTPMNEWVNLLLKKLPLSNLCSWS